MIFLNLYVHGLHTEHIIDSTNLPPPSTELKSRVYQLILSSFLHSSPDSIVLLVRKLSCAETFLSVLLLCLCTNSTFLWGRRACKKQSKHCSAAGRSRGNRKRGEREKAQPENDKRTAHKIWLGWRGRREGVIDRAVHSHGKKKGAETKLSSCNL